MKIMNLTGKRASDVQISDGLIDPPEEMRVEILSLLGFNEPPDADLMRSRASKLSDIPVRMRFRMALLDCPPYFVSALESALRQKGVLPVYSFEREVFVGDVLEDGALRSSIEKQHHKWVLPYVSLDSLPIRVSRISRDCSDE